MQSVGKIFQEIFRKNSITIIEKNSLEKNDKKQIFLAKKIKNTAVIWVEMNK